MLEPLSLPFPVERLSWLERYGRVTKRLAEAVARLCEVLPVKQVAEFYGLGWDAVNPGSSARSNTEGGRHLPGGTPGQVTVT